MQHMRSGRASRLVRMTACLAVLFSLFPLAYASAATRPNIVFLVTDDQRTDEMSIMKNVMVLLVNQGTSFTKSFVAYSLCCPARATFLTGQYPHNHHVLDIPPSGGYIKLDHTNTLPVWLQQAGYYTVHIGKYLNGYGQQVPPTTIPPGWTEWYAAIDPYTYKYYNYKLNENGTMVSYGSREQDYQTDVYARKAVDFIQRRAASSTPFFLSVSVLAPHDNKDRTPPTPAPRHKGRFATVPLAKLPSFNEADVSDKPAIIQAMPRLDTTAMAKITTANRQRLESLLAVDEAVKAIFDALEATNELANTVIIFVSDNGFLNGEHRVNRTKMHPYEESVRVPLIIRHPQFLGRKAVAKMVSHVDLAPTIVDLAQATPERVMDGRSLLPLVQNPSAAWRNLVLLEAHHVETGNMIKYMAVRSPNYVYVEHDTGERELYNISDAASSCAAADPYQLVSQHLNACYAAKRSDLQGQLKILRTCAGDTCWR